MTCGAKNDGQIEQAAIACRSASVTVSLPSKEPPMPYHAPVVGIVDRYVKPARRASRSLSFVPSHWRMVVRWREGGGA